MSGQPYNTPLDVAKARRAYLANLNLRAELDDKNLQANKVYTKTGQLPVEQTDTRTLSEKLADIERQKIDMRSKLLEITDGQEAGKIVEALSPDQITFLAQNFQPIKDQIKRNYALGVPAEAFTDYLIRYIEKFNLTRGVELGIQQSSARELLANQRTIMDNMASKSDVNDIDDAIRALGLQNSNLGRAIQVNLDQIQELLEYLPETFVELGKADNAIQKAQMIEIINRIVENLPTKVELGTALSQLERARTARDTRSVILVLQRLQELTDSGTDLAEEIAVLRKIVDDNRPIENASVAVAPAFVVEGDFPMPPTQIGRQIAREYKTIDDIKGIASSLSTKSKLIAYYDSMFKYIKQDVGGVSSGVFANSIIGKYANQSANLADLRRLVEILNSRLRTIMYGGAIPDDALLEQYGRGMKGKGVARARPSQVFHTDIDYDKGIKASPKFVPLGRYLINKRQLDKDIVAIKRPAGSTISTLPSQRVSRNFGNVMRKIAGGSLPTYEELSNLTDDERVYLHKVSKETQIEDKLSIPTPRKGDDEADINQFEILKGQILSGNDNIELVKKFKTILLKLSRKDLIPKAQVKDLLLDLATLGH
jgi:hypothetical protein